MRKGGEIVCSGVKKTGRKCREVAHLQPGVVGVHLIAQSGIILRVGAEPGAEPGAVEAKAKTVVARVFNNFFGKITLFFNKVIKQLRLQQPPQPLQPLQPSQSQPQLVMQDLTLNQQEQFKNFNKVFEEAQRKGVIKEENIQQVIDEIRKQAVATPTPESHIMLAVIDQLLEQLSGYSVPVDVFNTTNNIVWAAWSVYNINPNYKLPKDFVTFDAAIEQALEKFEAQITKSLEGGENLDSNNNDSSVFRE